MEHLLQLYEHFVDTNKILILETLPLETLPMKQHYCSPTIIFAQEVFIIISGAYRVFALLAFTPLTLTSPNHFKLLTSIYMLKSKAARILAYKVSRKD